MDTSTTDRQLLDQELGRYTAQGWRIVSQTDHGFQVAQPKKLNSLGICFLTILPAVLGCLALLLVPQVAIGIFILAGIGLVLTLIDYAVKKEELRYITADNLRARPPEVKESGKPTYTGLK